MRSKEQRNLQQTNQKSDKKYGKRMAVWQLVLIDVFATCCCLGAFLLYHYVLPRHLKSEEIVVATTEEADAATFELPGKLSNDTGSENDADNDTYGEQNDNNGGEDSAISDSKRTEKPGKEYNANDRKNPNKGRDSQGRITNYGNSDTMDIEADETESLNFINKEKTVTQVNSYSSDNIQFVTNKVEVGSGNDKITYYISDIYVTNVKYLKTAFAKGQYGKNIRESVRQQAKDNNALLAINGDYYGNNEIGVVIRNGVLYRSEVYDADLCVLFTDGVMRTYSPEDFSLDEILEQGAWQAWIFGPQLLDGNGNVLQTFNSTYYLSLAHPRTAIGYVEPGHYVFLVVDGRDEGYSRGATLTEMAQMMADAGCVSAYNLDGGESSEMVYMGERVNRPSQDGRDVSDIIYIAEE